MRLDALTFRGLTSAGEVSIDFTEIPPGIVALVGENGEGKTTTLEAALAAWFRRFPTRGELYPFVRDKAAIEAIAEHNGRQLRAVLDIDKAKRRQTAALFVDGDEVTDGSGGVRGYDEQIAEYLPAYDLTLAAAFAAQDKGGSFATADQAHRRALLREALGLGRWQRRWRESRDAGILIDRAVERVRDRAADLDLHRGALETAEKGIGRAQEDTDGAREERTSAEQARDDARGEYEARKGAAEAGQTGIKAWEKRRRALADAAADAERYAAEQQQRARTQEESAAALPGLREAQDRHEAATAAARDAKQALDMHEAVLHSKRAAVETARAEYRAAKIEAAALQNAVDVCERGIAKLPDLREKAERLAAAREQLIAAEVDLEGSTETRRRLREAREQLDGAKRYQTSLVDGLGRARTDAGLLGEVPCGGEVLFAQGEHLPGVDCGSCRLLVRATGARDSIPALEAEVASGDLAVERAEVQIAGLQSAVDLADESRDRAGRLRAEIGRLASVDVDLTAAEALETQVDDYRAQLAAAEKVLEAALVAGQEARKALDEIEAAGAETRKASETARIAVQDAPAAGEALQAAEEAAAQLEAAHEVAERSGLALLSVQEAVAEHRAQEPARTGVDALLAEMDGAYNDLERAGTVLALARNAEATAAKRLAEAQTEARLAQEAISRAEGMLAHLRPLEERRAGLQTLEQACGPTGVQALEMDAAGPGISNMVNEILRVAYGGRFSVQLVTQIDKTTGGKREICDIEVLDAEKGWRGPLSAASGGEQVVLEAALRLGFGAYLRAQGGDWRTVWLDEADGALDAKRAERFPSMMRAASTMSGAHHLLIVSHRETVWRQADSVIWLAGGEVRICDPGEVNP
jgi:DNA repair protein SbcC/Rad50